MRIISFVAAAALMFTACADPSTAPEAAITFRISPVRVTQNSDGFVFSATVYNTSPTTADLTLGEFSGFNPTVQDVTGRFVWAPRFGAHTLQGYPFTLAGGDSIVLSEPWNGMPLAGSGARVPAGNYEVIAEFLVTSSRATAVRSDSVVTFTILQ